MVLSASHKLTVTVVCRSHINEGDALTLYHLCQHPEVGKVLVVPLWQPLGGEKTIEHNAQLVERRGMFTGANPPRYMLGYDLTEVIKTLGTEAKPASMNTADVITFITSALQKTSRSLNTGEEEAVKTMLLGTHDRNALKNSPLRPLKIEELNRSDILYYEYANDSLPKTHQLFPSPFYLNDPASVRKWDSKESLPLLAAELDKGKPESKKLFPRCENVTTEDQLRRFMETHTLSQVALKEFQTDQGKGIFKVPMAPGPLMATQLVGAGKGKGLTRPVARLLEHNKGGMLAMEWLEPEKGDVRVLAMGGKVLGAYLRIPGADSELANFHQGGRAADYTLSAEERALGERVTKALAAKGHYNVGIDLLADKHGRRFISEINPGNAGGLMEINDFDLKRRHDNNRDRPSIGQQQANAIIEAFHARGRGGQKQNTVD